MGIVRMGPPEYLLEKIAEEFKIDVFVETGTYKGDTAVWAGERFRQVFTVENFRETYDQVLARYGHLKNVRFLYGHSLSLLPELLRQIEGDAIFWLDAHWMGEGSYGKMDECPLIDEIRLLNQSRETHFIFIDDARLFLSPPPLPHLLERWPSVGEVIAELDKKDRYTIVDEDVIISVPTAARKLVGSLVQEKTTANWQSGTAIDQSARTAAWSLKAILRKLTN